MLKAIFWCVIVSALLVLGASVLGVWKVYDLVNNIYAFSAICVVYFGMILATTGLLIYTGVKIKLVVDNLMVELGGLKVKIEAALNNLKEKLERVPKYVWNIIASIFKPKKQ